MWPKDAMNIGRIIVLHTANSTPTPDDFLIVLRVKVNF